MTEKLTRNNNRKETAMPIYSLILRNTQMLGEVRRYLVQAADVAKAEAKAISAMNKELREEPGENYVTTVELLGELTR